MKDDELSFRDFLQKEGVDVSPELKRKKRRPTLRESVRRLREMNLGLAALAAALLAAGAAVWKIERPARADGKESPVVELVFGPESEPAPQAGPAPAERTPAPTRPEAAVPRPPRPRPAGRKPGKEPVYHVVRAGDTLIGIAKKHYGRGWKWTEIARANPQAAADSWKLKVGAKLLIPPLGE